MTNRYDNLRPGTKFRIKKDDRIFIGILEIDSDTSVEDYDYIEEAKIAWYNDEWHYYSLIVMEEIKGKNIRIGSISAIGGNWCSDQIIKGILESMADMIIDHL